MSSKNISTPIIPGSWLGMLGGGQLGRMFTHAAQTMGYRVCVLDPDKNSPAAACADDHICAHYDDHAALDALAQRCTSISTEFENIPAPSLARLEQQGVFVTPNSQCIALTQDRIAEKKLIHHYVARTGIDVAPYLAIEQETDLAQIPEHLFPGILKTARMGYDGKGQINVAHHAELVSAWQSLGQSRCVLEQRLPLAYEVSVIVARGHDGQSTCYAPIENVHRQGILHTSTFPAVHTDAETTQLLQHTAIFIAEQMAYIGVLCIEFFILQDGRVVVNEMAPRPHNSGHITLNACATSQFEQQLRIMARLPLGKTNMLRPGMMLNLLGDSWLTSKGVIREPAWDKLCALPNAHLYLYGKNNARPGRKMGHINFVGDSMTHIVHTFSEACHLLNMQP